jgi:O-antigen ligase
VSNRTGDQRTVWDRQNQIAAGLRMLGAKPLFGFGWARYTQDDLGYFRQSNSYPMVGYSHASYETVGQLLPLHETYLAYAVELGLVGALLWLACLLWGVGGAILAPGPADLAPWKLGLFAVAICFATISLVNPYQSAFPVLLLWVWAGIARGSTPRSDLDELGRPCAR